MKNLFYYIFPIPVLLSLSLNAQIIAIEATKIFDNSKELAMVSVSAISSPAIFKVDNASKRSHFYAPKQNFDPANQYDSLFALSITGGLSKKTETGVVKLMNDNNKAQMVYYNNACAGTILKLTNPQNGKSTYVIVVGKIPKTESSSYMIKLSDMVARQLSIKDYSSVSLICYAQ